QGGRGLASVGHHQGRLRLGPVFEQVLRVAGLGRLERRSVEYRQRSALSVQGEGAAKRCALLLAVDLEGVGAWLRTEHGSATGPKRRAAGAGTSAARALLAPWLGAAAGHHSAGLGGCRAASTRCLLGTHALVHQGPMERGPKSRILELCVL